MGESEATMARSGGGLGDGAQPGDRPCVAVLPFANLAVDPEQRWLSDGITTDIITELSRFREILVIGRSSSFPCEPFASDTARVARQLGARYILEGSVQRSGDRLRITGQLTDSQGGAQIWSDRHDGTMNDLLNLQEEIAARIVGSIVPEIRQAEQIRAERLSVDDVQAYELALRAGALIGRGIAGSDRDLLDQGIALAQQAVAQDPRCGRAWQMLAWGYCRRGVLRFIGPETEADLSKADAAAQRLMQLDEGNHAAYAILGHIGMRRLRHDESLAHLRLANRINPNDVTTLRWLSWEESNFGLAEDARRHAELSLLLGPHARSTDQGHWTLALAEYVAGNLEGCIRHARQAVALNRGFSGHYLLLAAGLAESGAINEAREVAAELSRLAPGLLQSRLTGATYFAVPSLAERYVRALSLAMAGTGTAAAAEPRTMLLTDRERQVLQLVAQGMSNNAAAVELGLSEHTVKRHVANILTKLELPTRAAAAAAASRLGLL